MHTAPPTRWYTGLHSHHSCDISRLRVNTLSPSLRIITLSDILAKKDILYIILLISEDGPFEFRDIPLPFRLIQIVICLMV